jgi:hypothetical protein
MSSPESLLAQALFGLAFTAAVAYAAGRLHQWYVHAHERDRAWRDGYDTASRSLFHMAARVTRRPAADPGRPAEQAKATLPPNLGVRGTASVARHRSPPAATASWERDDAAATRPSPGRRSALH